MQFDANCLGARMAQDVGQRLLSHPEAGRFDRRIDTFQGWVREKLNAKIGALRLLVEVPARPGAAPSHPKEADEAPARTSAHLLQERSRIAILSSSRLRWRRAPPDVVGFQVDLRRRQCLAQLVVKFSPQMPSFVFLDLKETTRKLSHRLVGLLPVANVGQQPLNLHLRVIRG